jgi:hypothetical protein
MPALRIGVASMLTDEEIEVVAQDHLKKAYPADCEILHRQKRQEPDGIYFVATRPTDDFLESYIGDGGFFVARFSGEIWHFGSGQIFHEGLEYWLKWYAEGWRPGGYRLTVRETRDPLQFARLMVEHHVSYRVRELDHGVVWDRVAEYDEDLVLRRLTELPCTFLVAAEDLSAMFPTLKGGEIACFDYAPMETHRKYDWRPENNSPEQLGPQYE